MTSEQQPSTAPSNPHAHHHHGGDAGHAARASAAAFRIARFLKVRIEDVFDDA